LKTQQNIARHARHERGKQNARSALFYWLSRKKRAFARQTKNLLVSYSPKKLGFF